MRRKIALLAIFCIGIFVSIISVVCFLVLLKLNKQDLTHTQLLPGVWTITEVSVGIICGNLPLLRPLFLGFFKSTNFKPQSRQQAQYSFHNTTGTVGTKTGFERMPDNRSGDIESNYDHTDLELKGLARYGASHGMQQHLDPELGKIRVQTEVLVRTDENNQPPPRAW